MVSRFRSWWQQIKQRRVAIGVVGVVFVVVIALIIPVVWFNGTGFDGYNQVTIAHTTSGPSAGTVVRTEVYQPGKSLWDWLQLLIVPAFIFIAGVWFTRTQQRRDQQLADDRAQSEQKIATDNQREAALQAYIDKMSELLLLRAHAKEPQDKESTIARVRTLTVLRRLDGERKGSLLLFLQESNLISKDGHIIDLSGANLREASIYGATLVGADLSGVNLVGAMLAAAKLSGANLSKASLFEANISQTDLSGANLTYAVLVNANLTFANLSGALQLHLLTHQ